MGNNKASINNLSYQELVTIKGLYSNNKKLYDAIFDGNYSQVDCIMLTEYKKDLKAHKIINIGMLNLDIAKTDILAEQLTETSYL